MATRSEYSEEFKRDAIRLQETSGKSVGAIEQELGLSHNLLRQWKKRYQVNGVTDALERSEVEQLKAELRQTKRELEITRQERDILKKNSADFLKGCAAMKYPAVAACEDEFPLSRVCEVLCVSESGYYAWRNRPASQREQANQGLGERIPVIWQQFRGIYAAPRIHAELQERGEVVGHNRVARLMQHLGLRGKGSGKRQPRTTQSNPDHRFEPNILEQHFEVSQPDAVWLTDITYIPTHEG
jgi:transposase-like protein